MYTAIIVEPREHPALEFVLNNFVSNLSDEWNIIVFHGNKNIDFLKKIIENNLHTRISLINLQVDNLTINDYNNLFMKSTILYDNIPTETFLVFQTDTIIFEKHKHLINDFLKYDYVGAPIKHNATPQPIWVGNGGLSLRKKSKMLEIMNNEPYQNIPEDFFFSLPTSVSIYKPSINEANFFSVEAIFNEVSFGCHQIWINDKYNELCEMYPEAKELSRLNLSNFSNKNKMDIAIIYTSKIPFFKEHFASFSSTGINQYNTDCFLVLGNEYNEDVDAFKKTSIFDTTTTMLHLCTIKTPTLSAVMSEKGVADCAFEMRNGVIENDHKKKAAELISAKIYDIVIYTETQVIFESNIHWNLLNTYVNGTQLICANDDNTFIVGSHDTMTQYLLDSYTNAKKNIEFNYSVKPITIEKYNIFFGFRGLSEVCDSYKFMDENDEFMDISQIQSNNTIYFTNLSLRRLHRQIILIPKPFILVSGGGDCECPNQIFDTDDEFQNFINSPNIVHWFCQNVLIKHPKITPIPLGLDYETIMYYNHIRNDRGPKMTPLEQENQIMELRKNISPFWERIPICYGNFQYLLSTKYGSDRVDAIHKIPKNLIYYDSKCIRESTFKNQTNFAFVVSPFGQDYECIRTWEALCLGCIVILKTSPIDSIYADLPVLIINDWNEITQPFLELAIERFKQKHQNGEFNYEKLTKKYWSLMIQQKKG
jgi:hypothetical protein